MIRHSGLMLCFFINFGTHAGSVPPPPAGFEPADLARGALPDGAARGMLLLPALALTAAAAVGAAFDAAEKAFCCAAEDPDPSQRGMARSLLPTAGMALLDQLARDMPRMEGAVAAILKKDPTAQIQLHIDVTDPHRADGNVLIVFHLDTCLFPTSEPAQ